MEVAVDQRLAGIYLVIRELRELRDFSLKSFDDRLFLQKAIYLLQILGVDLRFRFSWYLRGPYSNALTQCAFEIDASDTLKSDFDKLTLRSEVLQVLKFHKQWLQKIPVSLSRPRWLELLSSIHYLIHISRPVPSVTLQNVGGYLETAGKQGFDEQDIQAAWDTLNKAGLIDHKTLPPPATLYESNGH